jgi:hypothetical protein
MRNCAAVVFASLLLSLLTPAVALADESLLCPKTHKWISIGDRAGRVLKRCGEPKVREDVTREGCTDDGNYCFGKVGERWIYDFGSTYFVRYLLFIDGRLTQIESGDYSKEP